MHKEDTYNGISSAIEKNETMPFAATWMSLELVILSEGSQTEKEKNKYCTLMHICGIQKNGIDNLIFKAEIETQM